MINSAQKRKKVKKRKSIPPKHTTHNEFNNINIIHNTQKKIREKIKQLKNYNIKLTKKLQNFTKKQIKSKNYSKSFDKKSCVKYNEGKNFR